MTSTIFTAIPEKLKKLKCINALTLKILAMAFMLCDHLWATIVPASRILTDIGRLAFPVFAFQMAEAFFLTHDRKKLMLRLLIFALISEIPFNLMTGGEIFNPYHQNVMFTFLIALSILFLLERAKKKYSVPVYLLIFVLLSAVGYALGTLCFVDYFGAGVATVLVFYLSHGKRFGWLIQLAGLLVFNVWLSGGQVIPITLFGHEFEVLQQGFAVAAIIFIWLYNGKRGPHNKAIQYSYYAFYPVHMLVLALLALYVV